MRARRIRLAVVVYGLLSLAAVLWGAVTGRLDLYHDPDAWVHWSFPRGTLLSLGLGLVVALLVIVSTRWLVRRTGWARRLHLEFRALLGPLSPAEITVFAIASGVAEELFFRGAMQPTLGLVLTAFIFGFAHFLPRMWPWTLWAIVMGFVFGVLYSLTGELLGAILAHVLINYENLHFIEGYDPTPPSGSGDRGRRREPSEPDLVATRLRTGGRVR